ncbi:hypothetical protein CF327_g5026 [Tilletia walkeri]|uniref:Dolichol phosphate-mannose biosynthesis regulatory protein n=2 Tax=Tilletia TaxID=13289 RepID=A0A8X7N965_9BASI|nr:hypothetical protein CF327_g5026 [Tilletia walkeri]KAE8250866.1 hypothetical protein A4X13_0g4311 [Tilletia indica]KAE8268673.1 hypothetical protein A4X09_0g3668 [Tilletia walkeri]
MTKNISAVQRISSMALFVALLALAAATVVSATDAGADSDGLGQQVLRRAKRVEPIPVSYPKAGLLHNYQFLSPGLLLAILVMGGLLGPLALFIVSRLSEIGTPDRLGAEPRKAPGSDKKSN